MLERIAFQYTAAAKAVIERLHKNPVTHIGHHKALQRALAEIGITGIHYSAKDPVTQALVLGFNLGRVAEQLCLEFPLMRGHVEVEEEDWRPKGMLPLMLDGKIVSPEEFEGHLTAMGYRVIYHKGHKSIVLVPESITEPQPELPVNHVTDHDVKGNVVDTSALDPIGDDALLGDEALTSPVGADLRVGPSEEGEHMGSPLQGNEEGTRADTPAPPEETESEKKDKGNVGLEGFDISDTTLLKARSLYGLTDAEILSIVGTGHRGKVIFRDVDAFVKARDEAKNALPLPDASPAADAAPSPLNGEGNEGNEEGGSRTAPTGAEEAAA